MTTIHAYDPGESGPALPDLPPMSIGVLAVGLVNLLQEAADLPQPRHATVCDAQAIGLQFEEDPASLRAITRWGLRFGGVLVNQPYHDEYGLAAYCETKFSYYGVAVTAFAFLPPPPGVTCADPGCNYCREHGGPAT